MATLTTLKQQFNRPSYLQHLFDKANENPFALEDETITREDLFDLKKRCEAIHKKAFTDKGVFKALNPGQPDTVWLSWDARMSQAKRVSKLIENEFTRRSLPVRLPSFSFLKEKHQTESFINWLKSEYENLERATDYSKLILALEALNLVKEGLPASAYHGDLVQTFGPKCVALSTFRAYYHGQRKPPQTDIQPHKKKIEKFLSENQ